MTAKTRSRQPAGTSKKPAELGKIIEPEETPLSGYIEHFIKYGAKKKGKKLEQEIDVLLETAREDLSEAEMLELEQAIAPERVEKREKHRKRRPKGEGLTRAEWRISKFQEAEEKGVWYPGYDDGCKLCGGTDRKHYSGGKCTKCYTIERNARLIKEGKMVDPAEKRRQKEEAKAAKAAEREKDRKEKAKQRLAEKRAEEAKSSKGGE